MNEGDPTSDQWPPAEGTSSIEHVHTWAAEPTGDDAHRYVCTECGEEKSEPPTP